MNLFKTNTNVLKATDGQKITDGLIISPLLFSPNEDALIQELTNIGKRYEHNYKTKKKAQNEKYKKTLKFTEE